MKLITLHKVGKEIRVILSASQGTERGFFLAHLYYEEIYRSLVDLAPGRTGFPHNGGDHTFAIRGRVEEVIAWLELVIETVRFDSYSFSQIGDTEGVLKLLIEEIKNEYSNNPRVKKP